jgi:hypothetical protein
MIEREPVPQWLLDLVRAFSPKEVPLDVEQDGTYEEATTRWGPNPVYDAVPQWIRDRANVRE